MASTLASSVTLQPITAETVGAVLRLAVAEHQTRFVATNAVSLAQALFAPTAWYRVVCLGDEPVGFVMLSDESRAVPPPEQPTVSLWRFMVDARHQRKGIGRAALQCVIDEVRARGFFRSLELSYVPGDDGPERLYRSMGFLPTGEFDGDEVVMTLALEPPADQQPGGVAADAASIATSGVRRLSARDAAAFLRLRLFALQESPTAFGSSHAEEKDLPVSTVEMRLAGFDERTYFGVDGSGGELVGLVGVGREQGIKQRHMAFVRSLYVAPPVRSRGVGRRLLQAAVREATGWDGIEQVMLAATAGNVPALALYRSAGFVEVGCRPRALCVDGAYLDELDMVLRLAPGLRSG